MPVVHTVVGEDWPLVISEENSFPRSIVSWLPLLWSRILFPGQSPASAPVRWSAILVLVVLPGILLYVCMSFQLFEPDEGRYAEIPREMMLRGEWVVPYLQGEPYLDKPPLLYWLVGVSYRLLGAHNWSARLIPALAIHGCILITYLLGRRVLGERAAFGGALMLAIAPGFVTIGRLLVLDGLLTFWVTLSLFAALEAVRGDRLQRGWWMVSALACGLGILTKGPVALLLLVPPLWAFRRLSGGSCAISWRAMAAFLGVTLSIALPWYVAICVKLPGFAYHFLWEHNVVRFLAPFDHLRPIWFYVPVLLVGLMPATLLLIPFLRFLLSGDPQASSDRPAELGFVLLTGGWCVLFFSVSGCKLPTYIMPAFPLLCLALGFFIARNPWRETHWPKTIGILGFVGVGLGHNVALPWYAGYRAPQRHIAELKQYCNDADTPIICYPRNCDSVAFCVGRDDLKTYRSKETHLLVYFLQQHPRTVLIFTHRHSLDALMHALTPDLRILRQKHFGLERIKGLPRDFMDNLSWLMGETSLGLCDIAVVEHKQPEQMAHESERRLD